MATSGDRVGDRLTDATAIELATLLASGRVSAREVLDAHLGVIEAVNPVINAICTLAIEQAIDQARRADEAQAKGESLGVLHGLPILHKDLLDTAGLRTTYGSPASAEHVPTADSLIVARARAAGAVAMGKTNTPQFGTGGHTSNTLFGTTYNPYDVDRSAGGSSGGSAAALAAGMAPLATGTDMAGSLRIPASFCGVVGFRPTPGRIPWLPQTSGHIPHVVAGPMARTVADVGLLLAATVGADRRASVSLESDPQCYRIGPECDAAGVRVAWAPGIAGLPVGPEVAKVLAGVPAALGRTGAQVVEAEPDLRGAEEAFRVTRAWYYATNFGPLLAERPDDLDARTSANVREGLSLRTDELERADLLHATLQSRVHEFFTRHDVLVLPSAPVVPFPADQWYPDTIDGSPMPGYLDWMRHLYYVTAALVPVLNLPVGLTAGGLPVGVQVVAAAGADLTALRFGLALETALGRDRHPRTVRPIAATAAGAEHGGGRRR